MLPSSHRDRAGRNEFFARRHDIKNRGDAIYHGVDPILLRSRLLRGDPFTP
jgi:hypothetical protein